jgi:hypothetical protein
MVIVIIIKFIRIRSTKTLLSCGHAQQQDKLEYSVLPLSRSLRIKPHFHFLLDFFRRNNIINAEWLSVERVCRIIEEMLLDSCAVDNIVASG